MSSRSPAGRKGSLPGTLPPTAAASQVRFLRPVAVIEVPVSQPRSASTASLTLSEEPPSVHLAAEHAEIRERLRHLGSQLAALAEDDLVRDRRRTMDQIITFIEEHIEQHTRREDDTLYPIIERHLGSGALTAALRVEHRFMLTDVDVLRRLAAEPTPDVRAFSRKVDNLLGLFAAHCAAEEEVLFPVVDAMAAAGTAIEH